MISTIGMCVWYINGRATICLHVCSINGRPVECVFCLNKRAVAEISRYINKRLTSGAAAMSLYVGLKGTAAELNIRPANIWAYTRCVCVRRLDIGKATCLLIYPFS